jgi:two-component system, OmpR family, phosphate regulon sensor histidine kinase PhoR
MFARLVTFLTLQVAGGVAGGYVAHQIDPAELLVGALAGALAGGLVWLARDLAQDAQLLRWLKAGDASTDFGPRGLRREIADRVRRQLRTREKATQASDARLQDFLAAMQVSPNGVVLIDQDARIEWFNQTAASHFRLDVSRDLMQHIGNLVRDPVFAGYVAGGDYRRSVTMTSPAGTPARPVQLAVQLHPYGNGRSLLLSRDITALEQADAMRRDFVANVSHEIRTPLTVLSGFVETLQTLPLNDAERRRYLALMAQQAAQMQTLVSDLLTLSKLEGNPPVGVTVWVPVHGLLVQVEGVARALAGVLDPATGSIHQIEFDEGQGGEIAGSHNELLSAMTNLACNAVRYTQPGGAIKVGWRYLTDGRGEFLVQDNGPGIAPEHIPRLTERFYRVDRSRSRDTGGTGLGLAIVKHVAQRHEAELRIESIPGKGSTFSIVFPASRVRVADPVS